VLGRAIKKHNLPRDEIVVLTKLFMAVSKDTAEMTRTVPDLDAAGYVNQYGLSRKVGFIKIQLRGCSQV
jgi:aryl-alcohol dehydrogenase-like predicted oxidoreductase